MPAQTNFVVVTILGVVCMLAGIGLIISGAVGLYSSADYDGASWGLLWAGIGLELIGSTLFAVARRIRWHYLMSQHLQHAHRRVVTSVEYVTPNGGYAYSARAYTVQGLSGQPLGVPQPAAFAAPMYAAPPGPPGYEYAGPPPMNQAPPAYEAPKD